jgi:hypothetical protein
MILTTTQFSFVSQLLMEIDIKQSELNGCLSFFYEYYNALLFSMRISGGRSGMEWYFDYGKLTCV